MSYTALQQAHVRQRIYDEKRDKKLEISKQEEYGKCQNAYDNGVKDEIDTRLQQIKDLQEQIEGKKKELKDKNEECEARVRSMHSQYTKEGEDYYDDKQELFKQIDNEINGVKKNEEEHNGGKRRKSSKKSTKKRSKKKTKKSRRPKKSKKSKRRSKK